eukprot:jgi/Galph1/3382/GphlegSOOS_G2018.1
MEEDQEHYKEESTSQEESVVPDREEAERELKRIDDGYTDEGSQGRNSTTESAEETSLQERGSNSSEHRNGYVPEDQQYPEVAGEVATKVVLNRETTQESGPENDCPNYLQQRQIQSEVQEQAVEEDAENTRERSSSSTSGAVPNQDFVNSEEGSRKAQPLVKLVERSLRKIQKQVSGRKHKQLRTICQEALSTLSSSEENFDSEKVVQALQLSCESGKAQVVLLSLDALQKLVAHGWFQSQAFRNRKEPRIIDDIVNSVCGCFYLKDDAIFLRMTQILLNIVTGLQPESSIHQGSLVLNVRTLYNIHLSAHSSSVRTISRAALTQVLHTVFSRMELVAAEGKDGKSNEDKGNVISSQAMGDSSNDDRPANDNETNSMDGTDKVVYIKSLEDSKNGDASETAVGVSNVNSSSVWIAESDRVARGSNTVSHDTDENMSHKKERVSYDFTLYSYYELLEKDAYLLFRALCKLSAREHSELSSSNSLGIRSKILSLELLQEVLEASGPAFRSSSHFIHAVRNILIPSLLTNCVAPTMAVIELALSIVEILLEKLRSSLKWEVSAIFHTVIFRYLSLSNANFAQCKKALQLINRIMCDPQLLADLFLNYDCDIHSNNIFERLVNELSRIIQKNASLSVNSVFEGGVGLSQPSEGATAAQEAELRQLALVGLSNLLTSLKEWSRPLMSSAQRHEFSNKANSLDVTFVNQAAEQPFHEEAGMSTSSENNDENIQEQHLHTSMVEKRLQLKREIEEGIRFFNFDADQGIEFLCKIGYLKHDAIEIASFLSKTEGLDATMVGRYLGDGDEFHVQVMHAYVDLYDFTGLKFDEAIRLFLSGFRLPGEAQKIDRFMEKFASRYCACNPILFANADTAYVLAYAVIMLNTDAHHPQVKRKMSKEEFIHNNRGINDGEDLPAEFLSELYDRIVTEEIRLGDFVKDSSSSNRSPSNRLQEQYKESERLIKYTHHLFSEREKTLSQSNVDYVYYSATNPFHGKLMFEVSWCGILAAVSVLLERAGSHDGPIVALCTQCFRDALVVASVYGMDTERNALASSLAKFTHLSGISEMRIKNIECIRAILQVAVSDGDYLGDTWSHILKAISQLEQIRAIAAGDPDRFRISDNKSSRMEEQISAAIEALEKSGSAIGISSDSILFRSLDRDAENKKYHKQETSRKSHSSNNSNANNNVATVDSNLSLVASSITDQEILQVFTNSVELSSVGIADFCKALCHIAWEEVSNPKNLSIYMLLKAVEVAHYNMEARIRVEWKQVWDHLEILFSKAGCHTNQAIAMFAIDALRQLAIEFLEREELSQYAFQRAFLKPFQQIFAKSSSVSRKEMILNCLSQIVALRSSRLRSGWKSIFHILSQASEDRTAQWNVSTDSNEDSDGKTYPVMKQGYQILDEIVREHLRNATDDMFIESIHCLAAYAKSPLSSSVSLSAINHLSIRVSSLLIDSFDESTVFLEDCDRHVKLWFPLLMALASCTGDARESVRSNTTDSLFEVLGEYGNRFSSGFWKLIFRGVLVPIFDDIRHLPGGSLPHVMNDEQRISLKEVDHNKQWAISTGTVALNNLIDLFVRHIAHTKHLLGDLLGLLESWINQESENLAREGVSGLSRLSRRGGEKFTADEWIEFAIFLQKLLLMMLPNELFDNSHQLGVDVREQVENISSNEVNHTTNISQRDNDAVAMHTFNEDVSSIHATGSDGNMKGQQISVDDLQKETNPQHRIQKNNQSSIVAYIEDDDLVGPMQFYEYRPDQPDSRDEGSLAANKKKDSPNATSSVSQQTSETVPTLSFHHTADFKVVRCKSVVQLLLSQLLVETVEEYVKILPEAALEKIVDSMETSITFARNFNSNFPLRFALWKSGFMNQVPNLLKQEMHGTMNILQVLGYILEKGNRTFWSPDFVESLDTKRRHLCQQILKEYNARLEKCLESSSRKTEEQRELHAASSVVVCVIQQLIDMSDNEFQKALQGNYELVTNLVRSESPQVRDAVADLLQCKVRILFQS